jgi:hypothetical protein
MPATIMPSDDGSYLIVRFIGVHSPAMQPPIAAELFSKMTAMGVRRALVDGRDQHARMSTLESHQLWEEMASRVPRGAKLAVVVGWEITGRPFLETVAVNRGVIIRYFNDMDLALEWLHA